MQQKPTSASWLGRFQSHGGRRTCTHTPKPTQTKPLCGEDSDRKLTSTQELANRFCHFWSVPAAAWVTSNTEAHYLRLDSSSPVLLSFQCDSLSLLTEEREVDPRRNSALIGLQLHWLLQGCGEQLRLPESVILVLRRSFGILRQVRLLSFQKWFFRVLGICHFVEIFFFLKLYIVITLFNLL